MADNPLAWSESEALTRATKMVYMVTASNVGELSREGMAAHIQSAYARRQVPLARLAVFREFHVSGEPHFHAVIKATKVHRWGPIAELLRAAGVRPHFSAPPSYAVALRYCTRPTDKKTIDELDDCPWLSLEHPAIEDVLEKSVRVERACRARSAQATEGAQAVSRRKRPCDVYAEIVNKKIKTEIELLAHAKICKEVDGDVRLLNFCLQTKNLTEYVDKCWAIEGAAEALSQRTQTRLDKFLQGASLPCVCQGQYVRCAEEVLRNNNIPPREFANAVLQAITQGARKGVNIYLCGVRNCGKSFLLEPLGRVFGGGTFYKPGGRGTYRLSGLGRADIVLWNDWRRDGGIIAWETMLLLGEGAPFRIPLPQNQAKGDVLYDRQAPLFLSAAGRMRHDNCVEEAMMDARFRYFDLEVPIRAEAMKAVDPCACCYVRWIQREGTNP